TRPRRTEHRRRLVFERHVGVSGTTEQRVAMAHENRSLLDAVRADFTRLSARLGPADRTQVQDYLDSVREVERRIQAVETLGADSGLPALERPRGIPERYDEHVKLMYELQWLAFQGDMTRGVTL